MRVISATSQQTYGVSANGILPKLISPTGHIYVDYQLLKQIALHPIVRLGIELIVGIIAKSPWRIVPDENHASYADFSQEERNSIQLGLQKNLDEFRDEILNTSIRNQIIYGWQAFERIMGWDSIQERFVVKEMKPLLQEFTDILTDETGNYIGLRNIAPTGNPAHPIADNVRGVADVYDIGANDAILFNIDVFGQNWYGTPLLLSAVEPYLELRRSLERSNKYLDKLSSVSGILYYPPGKITLENGVEVDNYIIAQQTAKDLVDNSMAVLPLTAERGTNLTSMNSLNAPDWSLQGRSDSTIGAATTFKDTMDKFESHLINALGLPTKVVLDGKFGSYSSNETYRETTYDILQSRANRLIRTVNKQFIDPITDLNFGIKGLFYIQPAPIDDDHVQTVFRLYPMIKDNPNVDMAAVHELLGIPDTDNTDKFELIDDYVPPPAIGGDWLNPAMIEKQLGMKRSNIRNRIKTFMANNPDHVGVYRDSHSRRYRVNSQYVKEVFGLPMDIDTSENGGAE